MFKTLLASVIGAVVGYGANALLGVDNVFAPIYSAEIKHKKAPLELSDRLQIGVKGLLANEDHPISQTIDTAAKEKLPKINDVTGSADKWQSASAQLTAEIIAVLDNNASSVLQDAEIKAKLPVISESAELNPIAHKPSVAARKQSDNSSEEVKQALALLADITEQSANDN